MIPLHIGLETTTLPTQTMPTQGWKVAFGGLRGFRLDVSQPFRGESDLATPHHLQPSSSLRSKMAFLCLPHSSFPPSFFIYLYQWMSGKPNCCYFHLDQANRYPRGKSFLFPSLGIYKKIIIITIK